MTAVPSNEHVRVTLRRGHTTMIKLLSFTVRTRLSVDPKYIILPDIQGSTHLSGDPKRSKIRISHSGRHSIYTTCHWLTHTSPALLIPSVSMTKPMTSSIY